MRPFLQGRPGLILLVGFGWMFYGLFGTYALMAFGWGGFLNMPIIIQVIGFGFTGSIFLGGLAFVAIGGYRCCRSLISN